EIVKDAKQIDGLFPIWQKDDKTWIEIPAAMIDKPFFLSVNMSRGIGEKMLFGGLMGSAEYATGGEYVGQFRKAGGNIQLLARNTTFVARPGSPEERAVRNAFSDSLLSSAPIVSAPHPERKSVLIEANALLLADIPRASYMIERNYRNSFSFDTRNSFIQSAKSSPERTVFDVTAHYSQPRIPVPPPPPMVPGAAPAPFYPPPTVIEDPRSLFLGFLYTFSKLPEKPMSPRLADSRIGHFATPKVDFSDESKISPVRFYVQRWRLEKKDPSAAVSEPVKPITFWLSNEIPEKHREPIRLGILEWNKAFEKIGYKDAIVVLQQPDDADFDLGETQYSSVRWMTTATPSFGAIGPTQVDPRTGEILDADIGWDASQTRNVRALKSEGVVSYQPMYDAATGNVRTEAIGSADGRLCTYHDLAAREVGFALALLEARGEFDPDSPEADRLVAEFLKDVTMHEVGHTLGLRHNFRASITSTQQQLSNRSYAERYGLTGSVMEYSPVNLALKGEPQGAYFTPTLGAYDFWAIEYAYKPIAPEQEKAELERIAARASEAQLAFATDEDVAFSIDPLVNQMDLGSDPLGFYKRRVKLSQELWLRLEARQLPAGESYSMLRRRFLTGFTQVAMAMSLAAKYVGGSELTNETAGSGRLPITPVTAARQREALVVITEGLFKTDSFRVSPEFMRKLVSDRLERDALYLSNPQGVPALAELGLSDRILTVQRDVLNRVMSPTVARRIVDARAQAPKGSESFTLAELYSTVQLAIWDEARRGTEAEVLRRNLQREHLRRMTAAVLGSSAGYPADARALLRRDARQLQGWLTAAAGKPGLSAETRAHYAEAAETLAEALKAPMTRSGV
ncbi:MAG TPA: zinc-dependent metalloprotease, partial [Burkholderiaceae bacterium]|nr:zinc-dependent metalloprotease [Burkholderiaceae bacterium]